MKTLEIEKTPSGQFRYRIITESGFVAVDWQFATFDRETTIEQARARFSFDAIS